MKLNSDFHLHSHNSCDSADCLIRDIATQVQALGITQFGITEHLHTRFNLPDVEASRQEFDALGNIPGMHFGLELSCSNEWECDKIARRDYASCFTCTVQGRPFQTMTPIDGVMYGGPAGGPLCVDFTEADVRRLKIEYILGGVHKPNYTEQSFRPMLEDLFAQSCFLIKNPLIDVLAHPWFGLAFWSSYFVVTHDPCDYREELFLEIPQEYWDELGSLLLEYGKCAEINSPMIFNLRAEKVRNGYMAQLAKWRGRGIRFTYGSDLHQGPYHADMLAKTNDLLTKFGFTETDFVHPFAVRVQRFSPKVGQFA